MEVPFRIVDVFTDRPLAGNQLCVVPEPVDGLDRKVMQAIAGEIGFSETTFVTEAEADRYAMRIFTPAEELPFAGHPTLGTAFLLGRTRFGYTFAFCLLLAGVFTLLTQRKFNYPDAGSAPILYLIGALVLAVAVAIETYFQNERWPVLAAAAVIGATALSLVLMLTLRLAPPGYALDPATGVPTGELFPGTIRLLTPFLNITGGLALAFGALFSAYMFMPKRRVLAYSLDPNQPGDHFLFNLLISPVAIVVNFVASLPGAVRALVAGRLHSRVLATILIAIGGFLASGGDALNRFGVTNYFQVGKFLALLFLLVGFLVSIEAFREIRIPFTSVVLRGARREPDAATAPPDGADGRLDAA